MEQFRSFIEDPVPAQVAMNHKRMTAEKLEVIDGFQIYNLRIKTQFPFDNRSSIVCFYSETDLEDGSMWMFNSSIGNEEITEKYRSQFPKDVFVNHVIGGVKVSPYEGGVDIINTCCSDPNGLIPDFVKKFISKK